jgi:hypothetical protein
MTPEQLTVILARRVMGWRAAPGRLMMGERGWKPAWRFQPIKKREDAFRLLDAADPTEYTITAERGRNFVVRVAIDGTVGIAAETSEARAITYAVARALGLAPGERQAHTGADSQ